MNSIRKKLLYHFRIHDKNELDIIRESNILKSRRFGISLELGEWMEFKGFEEFDKWINQFGLKDYDIMVRVYFTTTHNINRMQKKLKSLVGEWKCGNHKCSDLDCRYHINNHTRLAVQSEKVEWIWRCIQADEDYHGFRRTD